MRGERFRCDGFKTRHRRADCRDQGLNVVPGAAAARGRRFIQPRRHLSLGHPRASRVLTQQRQCEAEKQTAAECEKPDNKAARTGRVSGGRATATMRAGGLSDSCCVSVSLILAKRS
jgi:hypothetical protein